MDDLSRLHNISKKLNILYAEDDILLQKKTTTMFNNIFNKVDVVSNGLEALELYEDFYRKNKKYYDIVVTDIKMPKCDGLQLCNYLLEINKDQPVVVTSAHDQSEYLIEFINIGVKKFIKKPFTLDNIVSTFLSVCEDIDINKEDIVIKLIEHFNWNETLQILFKNNEEVKLSYNETVVLKLFLENQDKIFSNSDLFFALEDENIDKEFSQDSIKSIIKRLRKKLPSDFIKNIYGQGYKIDKSMIITHNT